MKRNWILMVLFSVSVFGNCQIIKKKIPDKLVVLTFDDAVESQYSIVAPLLKQYKFGATFYVCEFPTSLRDKYMTWHQIKQLDKMGFEIANHTRIHPSLTRLKSEQIYDQLDYIDCKCDSMHIAKPVTFAYPGYDLDSNVIKILKAKNFLFARAGGSRPYDPLVDHPLLVPSWAMSADNKQQIMDAFQEAKNGKIVVLTIHGVPDIEHPWVNTPPELFKEYMQYLSDNHFKVIALRDLTKYVDVSKAMNQLVPDFDKVLKN